MAETNPEIDRHYGRGGLLERLLGALRAAGKDVERLTIDDLMLVDEFHSRRRLATEELARLLAPAP
ncbi:MAG: SAM-dependent methyltransferase, partial [Proteobacteria bacterium]|nr:SAM-dependent methyltransferase [Pseudomonadota bacterium]